MKIRARTITITMLMASVAIAAVQNLAHASPPAHCYKSAPCGLYDSQCGCVRPAQSCGYEYIGLPGAFIYEVDNKSGEGDQHYITANPGACYNYRACIDPQVECPTDSREKRCDASTSSWFSDGASYLLVTMTDPC